MTPLLRRPLSRRTVLRGLGGAIALPLLEAMTRPARAQTSAPRPLRLMYFYVPCGIDMATFTPRATGPMADVSL